MRNEIATLLRPYRVAEPDGFRLKDHDPADTAADSLLARDVARLADLQTRLYAQDRWALLCICQGMDAAGKDGTIKHVMTGVNPQGVQVSTFKAPDPQELAHDFLWRVARELPPRGRIGIFKVGEPFMVGRHHIPGRMRRGGRADRALVGVDVIEQEV